MEKASADFGCSVTELQIEVVQHPTKGIMGLFKKPAIIACIKKSASEISDTAIQPGEPAKAKAAPKARRTQENRPAKAKKAPVKERSAESDNGFVSSRSDIIAPSSLVTAQDDYEAFYDENEYKPSQPEEKGFKSKEEIQKEIAQSEAEEASIKRVTTAKFKDDVVNDFFQSENSIDEVIEQIDVDVNRLFEKACFNIDRVAVSAYDPNTVLIEFSGEDAALLIGKEGYRYKALSYMLFNWINAKYGLQLRLEIAEFLKNQEEMVHKYLEGIYSQIDREGRAQTKILDGVLVQIALKKLRSTYPDKYVAIRTNRDGLKYIIINSFRSN